MTMHFEFKGKMSVEEGSSSMQDLKVRKPYTISRRRERWTTEEHQRFLEALRLHGRAWRRIQEHIGTKTAVQIRSHAQKFFSKVVKESATGGNGNGNGKLIDIPPPRPKRKPIHPYPRKSHSIHETIPNLDPLQTSSPIISASVPDNQSPTSVLSDTFGMESSSHEQEDGDQDTPGLDAQGHKCPMDLDVTLDHAATLKECSSVEKQAVSLRLFGRTVLVTDSHGTKSSSFGDKTKQQSASKDLQNQTSTPSQALDHGDRYVDEMKIEWNCCPASFPSMVYCLPPHGNAEEPMLWFVYPLNFPFPSIHPQNISSCEQAAQDECSDTGSNTTSVTEMETTHGIDANATGFLPYKS